MTFKRFWNIIFPVLKNKYVIALIVFSFVLLFLDSNNLLKRRNCLKKLHQLEKDKQYYQEEIQENSKKLDELKTNKENLEKFAREQYLMKKEDEDIFIIIEEE